MLSIGVSWTGLFSDPWEKVYIRSALDGNIIGACYQVVVRRRTQGSLGNAPNGTIGNKGSLKVQGM